MRGALMKRTRAIGAIIAIALLSSGCSRPTISYIDEGRTYTAEELLSIPEKVEPGKLAEEPTEESSRLRHEALVQLRRQGEESAEAAALITSTFSSETVGVPFYVETASFAGDPVTVVVEAIGRPGGLLEDERVWVIDEAGEVVLSGTR